MKKQKAFTMIELLVVIAIISILSTILMVAIDPVGQSIKADDAKRIAMINQLQKALELYNLDHGHYPQFSYWGAHTYHTGGHKTDFKNALAPYMKIDLDDKVFGPYLDNPSDPSFYYKSGSNDNYQHYGMMIKLLHPSNSHFEQNDGGYVSSFYEVGSSPRYCMEKYAGGGSNAYWLGTNDRCRGGN